MDSPLPIKPLKGNVLTLPDIDMRTRSPAPSSMNHMLPSGPAAIDVYVTPGVLALNWTHCAPPPFCTTKGTAGCDRMTGGTFSAQLDSTSALNRTKKRRNITHFL